MRVIHSHPPSFTPNIQFVIRSHVAEFLSKQDATQSHAFLISKTRPMPFNK